MKYTHILYAALTAAIILLPNPAHSQGGADRVLPSWTDDSRRGAQYPASEWYVGFAIGTLTPKDKVEEVRKRVEKEAQNKLAEGITVNIKAESLTGTEAEQVKGSGGSFNENIKKRYGQLIRTSTDAEVSRVELTTHHDQANNRVYALAVVKKSALAAYYVSRIEFYLQVAENDFKLAKQHAEADKKRSALEKTAEAKSNIGECRKYEVLLSVVDYRGDNTRRLLDKAATLMREIFAFETALTESAAIFITGVEKVNNEEASIIVPALQSKFSENGCRITDSRDDASHLLVIDAATCQTSQSGAFFYAYACVKAEVFNTKTGKIDAKINFTGPKEGWTNQERAAKTAFESAAQTLWKNIREKTEICR